GAGTYIGVIEHEVRIAVGRWRRLGLVRSQRDTLAIRVARGRLVLPGADRSVAVRVVANKQNAGRIRRLPLQLTAYRHRIALVVVGRVVVHAAAVLGPSVVLVHRGGEAGGERVTERTADRRFRLDLVVTAVLQVDIAVELVRGSLADEVHEAARGVAAEQRALRTAQ